MDPVILRYDEDRDEYYCLRCVYSGSLEEAKQFFRVLQMLRYGVHYDPQPQPELTLVEEILRRSKLIPDKVTLLPPPVISKNEKTLTSNSAD
jgi:hypothetical protein